MYKRQVPLIANGNAMNWDIRNAVSHTLEYTHNHTLGGRAGAVRALGFFTTTNMGSYRESLALNPEQPVIEATRRSVSYTHLDVYKRQE